MTLLVGADVVPSPVALILAADAPHADRAVRAGAWVRVVRGVYADAAAFRALPPWSRYLARVHAVALAWPESVFCLESSAALRGQSIAGEPRDVHVVVSSPEKSRAQRDFRVHTTTRMPEIEQRGALRMVNAADTVVDVARARHPAVGLALACSALRADPSLDVDTLERLNAERDSTRGCRQAQWALARATGVPESTLEVVSLAVIEWLGFPAPELQKWVLGPSGTDDDRLDFWWESWRIGGEADGDIKYSGELGDARQALRARNRRDARLADRGVSATAHWTWSDTLASRQLRALLRAAGLPLIAPERAEPLRTLAGAFASPPRPSSAPRRRRSVPAGETASARRDP